MSLFRLLSYFFVLLSIAALASIARNMVRGKRRSAFMTLRVYLMVVAVYFAVLLATTLALPIQVLTVGDPQFSGDWSITVESVRRVPHDPDEDYEVDFRLSNHGARPIHGEKGLIAYLVGENGTRYSAASQPSSPAFDAVVNPGKSIRTTRKFVLPTNLNRVELVLARGGPRLGWFIIGRTPFDGRTVVHLQ